MRWAPEASGKPGRFRSAFATLVLLFWKEGFDFRSAGGEIARSEIFLARSDCADVLAAVDHDVRSGTSARHRRAEEQNRSDHLFGLHPAPEWQLNEHACQRFCRDLGLHLRSEERRVGNAARDK